MPLREAKGLDLSHSTQQFMMNTSLVKEFIFLGFGVNYYLRILLFFFFLGIYMLTVFGNVLIIALIFLNKSLNLPMYIFLGNLALSDIIFTTNVVPNMLTIILRNGRLISLKECVYQFFFYGSLGSTECFLLTVMSYDRYLAICKPLNYYLVMGNNLQKCLIILSWVPSFIVTLIPATLIHQLEFCDQNIIDHFFCDLAPLLEISCTDTFVLKIEALASSIFVVILPFLFVCSTYVCIIHTILNISTSHGRQKAFSTCSSHLVMVCMYFLTIITVYSIPSKVYSSTISKTRSLLYIVLTPLFNPIVYSLRNKEIEAALHKLLHNRQLRNTIN
ncbi:hypothetical protein XELAEV_18019458mg [Xenopus laevis]|uniref:Olfactory receptor n=1 Tax=Xenopus laevis TaxID=8355 RepID=A0A974HUV6_XENLA|nr:hypothetical protein XELAEV_18019458mg [Xenopus laevis]